MLVVTQSLPSAHIPTQTWMNMSSSLCTFYGKIFHFQRMLTKRDWQAARCCFGIRDLAKKFNKLFFTEISFCLSSVFPRNQRMHSIILLVACDITATNHAPIDCSRKMLQMLLKNGNLHTHAVPIFHENADLSEFWHLMMHVVVHSRHRWASVMD